MQINTIKPFHIIGIAIRTTNENGKAAIDIPMLWQKFFSENIMQKIPNKVDNTLYCIYTEYEKDYTKPYTTLLGCQVSHIEELPSGLTARSFEEGCYQVFSAIGSLNEGIVFKQWSKIWTLDIPRAYTADFEVYNERAFDADNATVNIYIAVKNQ